MSNIPPLPDGFVVEQHASVPPLPDGFQIEPAEKSRVDLLKSSVTGIPGEIYRAGSEAVTPILDKFNPYSGANVARMENMKNSSFIGGMADNLSNVADTGKALLGFPALAASPVTGTARSVIGNLFDAADPLTPEMARKVGAPERIGKDVADMAMSAIRPAGASPVGLKSSPPAPATSAELKSAARAVYNDPAIKSIVVDPKEVASLSANIQNDLISSGFRPTAGNAPGTFAEINRLSPSDKITSVGVDDLRAARRALNITAKEIGNDFRPTPDAVAAKTAINKLDSFIDTLAPELKTANANYSAAKQADILDYRAMKAERRAAKTGGGSNIENTLRQEIDKVPTRGLSKDQLKELNSIVEGTLTRNALRKMGKLGFNDGITMMAHALAAYPSGGASIPVGIAGTLARVAGENMTARQIANLNSSIRASAPFSKSLLPKMIGMPGPVGGTLGASLMSGSAPRQLFPLLAGQVPAHADEDKRRLRR